MIYTPAQYDDIVENLENDNQSDTEKSMEEESEEGNLSPEETDLDSIKWKTRSRVSEWRKKLTEKQQEDIRLKDRARKQNKNSHSAPRTNEEKTTKTKEDRLWEIREKGRLRVQRFRNNQSENKKNEYKEKDRNNKRKMTSKQNHKEKKRKLVDNLTESDDEDNDEHTSNTHYLGKMTDVCSYCGAVTFKATLPGQKTNVCCHKGKIRLPPLKYPKELLKLYNNQEFMKNIRKYNNLFAFASFGSNYAGNVKNGPSVFKIQGQVYHRATASLYPEKTKMPVYGQIYMYDGQEAIDSRKHYNNDCDEKLIKKIQTILQKSNPYVKKFRQLRDVYQDEKDKCKQSGRPMPHITLQFGRVNQNSSTYNLPTVNECSAVFVSKDGGVPNDIDLCVYPYKKKQHQILSKNSCHVDPMVFPLLFPKGETGWTINRSQNTPTFRQQRTKQLTPLLYYSYRLSFRPSESNVLLKAGKLTQQFVVHGFIIIESTRMSYLRKNQNQLRIECYQGLLDHIANNPLNKTNNQIKLGNIFILPSTYIGSPRNLQMNYQNAMAIVGKTGKSDYFITFTCNPHWREIEETLEMLDNKSLTVYDIPTFVDRIFWMKYKCFLYDVLVEKIFGTVAAFVFTIEFQKRGLPHAHLLITIAQKDKIKSAQELDQYIRAEIPDEAEDPELHQLVLQNMIHGPHNKNSPCLHLGKCTKGYPKPFREETTFQNNGYPSYRRRRTDVPQLSFNGRYTVDNSMVVPYNAYLLRKYKCHINVEYCGSIVPVKYIYKYIHKGYDRAKIEVKNEEASYDEITDHLDTRYISPSEAAWRQLKQPLQGKSHQVIPLPVHLENKHFIVFKENEINDAIRKKGDSKLTAWFKLNEMDELAKQYLYEEIPHYYCWKNRKWIARKNVTKNIVTRLNAVSPKNIEQFHLRLLLMKIRGATSMEDLKTVEDITYNTFQEAAIKMNLVNSTEETQKIFEEAILHMTAKQLRQFFVLYLVNEFPSNTIELWTFIKPHLGDDFRDENNKDFQIVIAIEKLLQQHGSTCTNFGLPGPTIEEVRKMLPERIQEDNIPDMEHFKIIGEEHSRQFNKEQATIFKTIINNLHVGNCYFIDGPGGCGKTFLYNGLIATLKGMGKIVLTVAWTGIAATLLIDGITSHKAFKIPLQLEEDSTCFVNNTDKEYLHSIDVIIWDEASMIHSIALEAINKILQDIMNNASPFGGKTVILGGDFRQLLPVVPRGTKSEILQACIKSTSLFAHFKTLPLTTNMRSTDENYSKWLLDVGNGKIQDVDISAFKTTNIHNIFNNIQNEEERINTVILCTLNKDALAANNTILDRLAGDKRTYESIDELHSNNNESTEELNLKYQMEYINSITPNGMPPHKLHLKIGSTIILLRNLSLAFGLCNGTRLIVRKLHDRILECELLHGPEKGKTVFIPRINMTNEHDRQFPFILHRRQFPGTSNNFKNITLLNNHYQSITQMLINFQSDWLSL